MGQRRTAHDRGLPQFGPARATLGRGRHPPARDYTEQVGPRSLDGPDRAILDLLEDGEGHGTREIAGVIGLTPRATRTRLRKLVDRGLVREIGQGPRDPKRRYYKAGD